MRTATRVLRIAGPLAMLLLAACGGGGGTSASSGYSVGGSASGLSGRLVLENNGRDVLTVSANGPFSFSKTVGDGGSYNITIRTQPGGQTCSVSNASGKATGKVTNVAVDCVSHWTWVSGSSVADQSGVYGVKGVGAASNAPGSRQNAVSATGSHGKLWLFGGWGIDSNGKWGTLNDLWHFDGTRWTWMSGSNVVDQIGVYGTRGVAAADNVPGARNFAVSWADCSGRFWLFGGRGFDSAGDWGDLNDLWQFDGSQWTWVSGSNLVRRGGVYGTKGQAAADNVPGARELAVGWTDGSGNLWLFGGWGLDASSAGGDLNDLWKFDGQQWTWVSGSIYYGEFGVYGTQGVAAPGNAPGARESALSWTDNSGNLWLFGGVGFDAAVSWGELNDLWKFDGQQWTWVSGSDAVDQFGSYGTQGVAAAGNAPGSRINAVSWTDRSGALWLFGGVGFGAAGSPGKLNDLWKFDGARWTWVNGSNANDESGVYGTQGVAAAGNVVGARESAVAWTDSNGKFWLFGGYGVDSGVDGDFNDLWSYQP